MNYPRRVIKEGESDKTIVSTIQAQLEARGCGPLDKTGVFGPKTKASVKLFQARNVDSEGNPLKQDGKVGRSRGLRCSVGNTDASLTREGGGVYRLKRKLGDINKGFIDYGSSE